VAPWLLCRVGENQQTGNLLTHDRVAELAGFARARQYEIDLPARPAIRVRQAPQGEKR
jgi:hypothetical protein